MANSDKDILITPNKNQTALPEVNFVGFNNTPIKLRVLDDNTLSFEGSAGQLFSINNNLTLGTIFAVSDVSGVPSLSVDANGTVALNPFNGNLAIGKPTAEYKVDIAGQLKVSTQVGIGGSNPSPDYGLSVGGGMRLAGRLDVDSGSTVYRTVSCYIRGTGLNNNAAPVVLVDGVNFVDAFGRGITLVIINKSNLTRVSRTTYDVYGDPNASNNLAAALDAMTNAQIGIMVSYDAIELSVTETLRTSLRKLGLYKFAGTPSGSRRPYAAIFTASASGNNKNVVEVYQSNAGNATYATIYTRLFTDGSAQGAGFSGTNLTNALISGEPNTADPVVFVNQNGDVGINTTNPSSLYAVDCIGGINIDATSLYYQGGNPLIPTQSETTRGAILRSDGIKTYWDNDTADTFTGSVVVRGYTMGGYQNGVGWINVNRTDHASDTTYNLGDQVTTIDAYCAACSNGTYAYVLHPGGNWTAQGREINRFNMLTDTNADIATQMLTGKDRTSLMRSKFTYAYSFGNGQPEKFNILTETPSLFLSSTDQNGSTVGNPACGQGELRGWHMVAGTRGNFLEFTTETWNAWTPPGPDGTNKTFSTYTGFMYWNTGGGYTTGNPWSKRHDYNGTQYLTIGKPAATGEESLHTGELKGYMVGMYNGAQNNQGGIMNYANNTFTFVSSVNSVGVGGRASAAGMEYGRGV
jgi:hypothetical protein